MDKLKLPPCGLLLGTGIYPLSRDYLLCTLHGHQTWVAEESSPVAMLDRVLADRQGNLVQLWGHARGYSAATQAEWFMRSTKSACMSRRRTGRPASMCAGRTAKRCAPTPTGAARGSGASSARPPRAGSTLC